MDTTLHQTVEEILKHLINPALAEHAGSAILLEVEDTPEIVTVVLEMQAGCAGCPMSQTSTKMAIERLLATELERGVVVHVRSESY
jgi:Fe-S cluster biogenesis protein NfuA